MSAHASPLVAKQPSVLCVPAVVNGKTVQLLVMHNGKGGIVPAPPIRVEQALTYTQVGPEMRVECRETNKLLKIPDSHLLTSRKPLTALTNAHLDDESIHATIDDNFIYTCALCKFDSDEKSKMRRHLHTHSDVRPFMCAEPNCMAVFKTEDSLRRHAQCHDAEAMKKEQIETTSTADDPPIDEFERALNGDDASQPKRMSVHCTLCLTTFSSMTAVNSHMSDEHADVRAHLAFQCEHCHFRCPERETMDTHLVEHSRARRYDCASCRQTFGSPIGLSKHLRDSCVCAGRKPRYTCRTCAAPFVSWSLRRAHERENHAAHSRRSTCTRCARPFLDYHSMNAHRKNCFIPCPTCPRLFTSKADHRRHIVTCAEREQRFMEAVVVED